MANRAYLVGSDTPDTAGANGKGINYNPDTEILAGASYLIPIFWFSLFDESHLKTHQLEEHLIPTLVADADASRRLLATRRATVLATFPQCESHWNAWTKLITEAPFKFFKIDSMEIWMLGPEQLQAQLPAAVRWYATSAPADLANLLKLASIPLASPRGWLGRLLGSAPRKGYNPVAKTITPVPQEDLSLGHKLYGYSWVRPTTWKD